MSFKSIRGTPVYSEGLGYSPSTGPGIGGPIIGPGNFYQYNINDLLPTNRGFGFGKSHYNPVAFPNLGGFANEIGPGNTPGGEGGVNGPWLYTQPLTYFNYSFGKSKKTKKSRKRRKSRKSRKGRKSKKRGKK